MGIRWPTMHIIDDCVGSDEWILEVELFQNTKLLKLVRLIICGWGYPPGVPPYPSLFFSASYSRKMWERD